VISRQHNCIFVHIPKTAGQSVEHVFVRLLNLTWKTRSSLCLRPNDDPAAGPPRLAHLRARDYVQCGHLTTDEFRSFFKFTFVRNPWDRMVSIYKYLSGRDPGDFNDFVLRRFPAMWRGSRWFIAPQSDYIFDERSNLAVDFVGRFERLQSDFDVVCQRLGLPGIPLPHANASRPRRFRRLLKRFFDPSRANRFHKDFREYFNDETRKVVQEHYAEDIANFGYAFD
jgi:hypothetical protein